ncbi:MAG: hypothetical protein JMN24_00640 [gamma proteobacterium endosymbiont of Lamellibrachia anaximandri]|nr:hypothetical protein [gamma proteobacterium endosymbiont of Lamellibrachia anaximandri]
MRQKWDGGMIIPTALIPVFLERLCSKFRLALLVGGHIRLVGHYRHSQHHPA